MKKKSVKPVIDRARYESFGGIISCLEPPMLAWVDKEFMRTMGYENSPLWQEKARASTYLSAPTEVHLAVTNRCGRGCEGCYMDSQSAVPGELSTAELKKAFLGLRNLGVFHVALGGGEAFERSDFPEIVSYCREIGLVPNLTTSGNSVGDREIEICKRMGQVNVSIDGIGPLYGVNGRNGDFELVKKAIRKLKKAGVPVGINCVVSHKNFPHITDVVAFASAEKLNEVEFLKFKPSGRGRRHYAENALTQNMIRAFYPALMRLGKRYGIELKIDCSFIPAMLFHKPPKDELEKLAVTGCDAGNMLMSVRSNGVFAGCSFMENKGKESVFEIAERWHSSEHLKKFRDLVARAKQPCRSCTYLTICRGGCRATASYYAEDFFTPDPECPFVYDYAKGRKK
ncbi:MAG: radical SAM protein [Chitinispirillaceae bacterium]|jgi:radical SAM protein with 4Fe4S-binding SPASM domain|nr:radical SAM protein [Chitinispirillaceae bacterium]